MEAFVLIALAICFVATCIMLAYCIKESIVYEDPLYAMGAAVFMIIFLAVIFLSYEFNNYIGGIL